MKYTISGATHLEMIDNKWFVNGEEMDLNEMVKRGVASEDGKSRAENVTEITIIGDVSRINGNFGKVIVEGSCNRVKTLSGNVEIRGDVGGDVSTTSGSVTCGNVEGDVSTTSGSVTCG
jgi:hypothetical protein